MVWEILGNLLQKNIKDNLSEAHKGQISGMKNKHHTKETKDKISKANKGAISWNTEKNHCNISQENIEWINGELLGDGSLVSSSSYSARVCYASKFLEYINYISIILKSFGIEQSGEIYKQYHKKFNCYSYGYHSKMYVELLAIRRKWYPNGKKIVPRDIIITPITLRQWFIGDGYLRKRKKGRPHIILATDGFSISDIEWLVVQLNKLGFKAKRVSLIIYISAHSTREFVNYIGECPAKCYQYKFDY